MTISVQNFREVILSGLESGKNSAKNGVNYVLKSSINAGEKLKGLSTDAVTFAKANPVKAGIIALCAAAATGAVLKLTSIAVSKIKEHREEKKIEAAINQRNAAIAAIAPEVIAEAKTIMNDAKNVITIQQKELDRLNGLVEVHKIVHEADQESINAYHEAISANKAE